MKKEIYNMDLLKLKLTEILNHIEDKNDVVYLDYPLHYNVGDLLIFLGGIQFLSKNEINVKKFYCVNNLKINDEVLKELYNKEKPKTVPTYNIYNIFVCWD